MGAGENTISGMGARTITKWLEIFRTMEGGANAVNCAYRVLGDLLGWSKRGGHRDIDADQIANAMQAFRVMGQKETQAIYVEVAYIDKFTGFMAHNRWWFQCQWASSYGKYEILFEEKRDLRKDLPTALHGKFSVRP